MQLFKHSPRDTDALGDAVFPKDYLPGVSSPEQYFRQTSGVRGVERAQRAQGPLDKPQPTLFFCVRKVLGALPGFFWRLLSWHPVFEQFLALHFL